MLGEHTMTLILPAAPEPREYTDAERLAIQRHYENLLAELQRERASGLRFDFRGPSRRHRKLPDHRFD
jgi:hypothetical protein